MYGYYIVCDILQSYKLNSLFHLVFKSFLFFYRMFKGFFSIQYLSFIKF